MFSAKTAWHALVITVLAGIVGSCAGQPPSSKAFRVEPEAPQPRLNMQWREQVASWEYFSSWPNEFASPTHVGSTDELLVGSSSGELIKFQAANGSVLWRVDVGGPIHAAPDEDDGVVFVGDVRGNLAGFGLATGRKMWQIELESAIESKPTVEDGRLFVTDVTDTLYAFDAATGEELWRHRRPLPEFFTVKGSGTPVVDRDAVYCGYADGFLVALQIDTGEVLWAVDLTGGKRQFVDVDEPVVVDEDTIYVASYAGGLYALDAASGGITWHRELNTITSFDVHEAQIYVASAGGRVVAVNKESGQGDWSFRLDEARPSGVRRIGPFAAVTTTEGPLYVLDAATGYPMLKWKGNSGFFAPLERGGERAYVLSNYGQVYAMKLAW